MSKDWYNMIALKNGGYKSDAKYTKEGLSGEDEFESLLEAVLPQYENVLDMGCGHGEFTILMSKYCKHLTGADNSEELLKIANQLLKKSNVNNVKFKYAWTKGELPFEDDQFDLIYVRRGPTSIVKNSRILKSGGKIIGIHTFDLDKETYISKLKDNGFHRIQFEVYEDARYYYENSEEFAKHLSSMHCSKDYTLEENHEELKEILKKNMSNGRISWPENRYIWTAIKL